MSMFNFPLLTFQVALRAAYISSFPLGLLLELARPASSYSSSTGDPTSVLRPGGVQCRPPGRRPDQPDSEWDSEARHGGRQSCAPPSSRSSYELAWAGTSLGMARWCAARGRSSSVSAPETWPAWLGMSLGGSWPAELRAAIVMVKLWARLSCRACVPAWAWRDDAHDGETENLKRAEPAGFTEEARRPDPAAGSVTIDWDAGDRLVHFMLTWTCQWTTPAWTSTRRGRHSGRVTGHDALMPVSPEPLRLSLEPDSAARGQLTSATGPPGRELQVWRRPAQTWRQTKILPLAESTTWSLSHYC